MQHTEKDEGQAPKHQGPDTFRGPRVCIFARSSNDSGPQMDSHPVEICGDPPQCSDSASSVSWARMGYTYL